MKSSEERDVYKRQERNGIKIGDKVTGINDPNNGDPEVDMEIVG